MGVLHGRRAAHRQRGHGHGRVSPAAAAGRPSNAQAVLRRQPASPTRPANSSIHCPGSGTWVTNTREKPGGTPPSAEAGPLAFMKPVWAAVCRSGGRWSCTIIAVKLPEPGVNTALPIQCDALSAASPCGPTMCWYQAYTTHWLPDQVGVSQACQLALA